MEIVLIQLADETGKVAVFKVLRQDGLGEFLALESELATRQRDRSWTKTRAHYL